MPLYRHPAGIQGQLHTSRFPASSSALLPASFFTSHHISYLPLLHQVLFEEISRMEPRDASHAGSWYSDSQRTLSRQLDQWLAQVPDQIEGLGSMPIPGARIIIAPYGYDMSSSGYSADFLAMPATHTQVPAQLMPTKRWICRKRKNPKPSSFTTTTYGILPICSKRIFILGPSHHHYLSTLALPELTSYSTPLSDDPLPLDTELINKLLATKATRPNGSSVGFTTMSRSIDEDEHSIELHLPYIHRRLQLQYPDKPTSEYPPLVPIMVGSTSASTENAFGALLAPYLEDPSNAFVISSDFCHWGSRFRYTYYVPQAPKPGPRLPLSAEDLPQPGDEAKEVEEKVEMVSAGQSLQRGDRISSREPAIHESISAFDIATMAAITTGTTSKFLDILQKTGNTVCGRHPIGVIMAAIESVTSQEESKKGRFHFIRYERSSDAVDVTDSSVSYVSAVAVL